MSSSIIGGTPHKLSCLWRTIGGYLILSNAALAELVRADMESFEKFLDNMPESEKRDVCKMLLVRANILGENT